MNFILSRYYYMRFFIFCVSILFFNASFGQSTNTSNNSTCSEVLQLIISEWIKDSLGITGYRAKYFEALKDCQPDKISKQMLFEKLGKPSIIRKSAFGKPWKNHVEYVYFIINVDPKGKHKPFEGLFLSFVFDENEKLLEQIINGDFCG
jgi:hypothetical protein